jgi:predicted metal-binding protein
MRLRSAATSVEARGPCVDRGCKDACSGYGSQALCPPLIVLAVFATVHGPCAGKIAGEPA